MTQHTQQYDAIIIGAGHNGLVAAGYLARAGKKEHARSKSLFQVLPCRRVHM